MYFLAIIMPPLAVLFCGKPWQALLNIFLCLLVIVPGIVHAILVVNEHKARQRQNELAAMIGAAARQGRQG
jgi:uncharacterized membrane protein YqaE (UPF0057 family)